MLQYREESSTEEMEGVFQVQFNFPVDFLWGSAKAGHQVEGNNVNSDSGQISMQRDRLIRINPVMRLTIIDYIKKPSRLWQAWD